MLFSEARPHSSISNLSLIVFAAGLLLATSLPCTAQGATDHTGTGGRHTIQGRIVFPSGRRADSPGLLVKLESVNNAPLSVFTDSSGSFAFKNLVGGSYTIVIESTENYETASETV